MIIEGNQIKKSNKKYQERKLPHKEVKKEKVWSFLS